jgi:hypothetical protein
MCHYITAVLPRSADHSGLDALAREHGRQFKPLSNPGVQAQLQSDEQYFITTTGHCDCGTPLGALLQGAGRSPDWAAQEQRLLRKGWSKAKVARALAQKQEDLRASSETSATSNLMAVSSWVSFIGAVLGSGKTSHLGLLLHMYSGSIESHIALAGREVVRSTELTGELLGRMKEDVLYVFRP